MSRNKCVIILSEKSSGSSACQNLLTKSDIVNNVDLTRHNKNETLFWTKAASMKGRYQIDMVNSEVPIKTKEARQDIIRLLENNLNSFKPERGEDIIHRGWKMLCDRYGPIFLEKSPHHLCQWSALDLIIECIEKNEDIDFMIIGLVRNPMDTIYSQFDRFGSPLQEIEKQWLVAYHNLLLIKEKLGDIVLIVRYEDIVQSVENLGRALSFCGFDNLNEYSNYFHDLSIGRWKNDASFKYELSDYTIELAKRYGYKEDIITQKVNHFSSMYKLYKNTANAIKYIENKVS